MLIADDSYPALGDSELFKIDLKRSSLVANPPNLAESGHFIGIGSSISQFQSTAGETHIVPSARITVYPNPGYNVWVNIANWPGPAVSFDVGVGLQVEFNPENPARRQALGLSWHEIYGDAYTQRDVSVHGLYGVSKNDLDFGAIVILDMHHVLVDNGKGIPDYDENFFILMPYIGMMFMEKMKIAAHLPYNSEGLGLVLNAEFQLGKRQ